MKWERRASRGLALARCCETGRTSSSRAGVESPDGQAEFTCGVPVLLPEAVSTNAVKLQEEVLATAKRDAFGSKKRRSSLTNF